jgi:iron-sulfur cluster insertion protein
MAELQEIGGKPGVLEGSGANHYIRAMNHIAADAAPSSQQAVSMTASAAAKVAKLVAGEGNPNLMLRLAVSGGGCSGFSYGFSLDDNTTTDDKVLEFHGAKLVIDDVSLDLLKGSEIDYTEDLLASSFRITNPNAKSTCGCGTSFAV